MKYYLSGLLICLLALPLKINAQDTTFNYEQFTHDYFAAWTNVQKPKATPADLELYLTFLTDDIGYQHLPYSNNDSRKNDGKALLRKGMTYYLGIHTQYTAKLTKQSFGHNVITIEFHTQAKGIHPDNGQEILINNTALEVLEIEQGKISVIRHYSD
jgi:hypothetical protein